MRTNMMMLTVLFCCTTAYGDTFVVNSLADAPDTVPGDGVCAAGGGACTLRAAIMEANALAGDDVIELPAGVFALVQVGDGEDAAATGDLDITDALRVEGAGRDDTIIDGIGADRVFHMMGATVALQDLTIRGGARPADHGGGIRDDGLNSLKLTRVRLTDNTALNGGGALKAGGNLTLEDCFVDDNHALANAGGVFHATNADLNVLRTTFDHNTCISNAAGLLYDGNGDVTLSDSSFTSNTASSNVGGAYMQMLGGLAKVTGCTFESNVGAINIGGLFVQSAGTLILRSSRFASNTATTGRAGGLATQAVPTVDVDDIEVSSNSGREQGAGAMFMATNNGSVTRCAFFGNHLTGFGAPNVGAGMYVEHGNWTATDCAFDDNTANEGAGAGLFMEGTGGLTLVRCTFSNNTSTAPAGIAAGLGYDATLPGVAINCTFSRNTSSGVGGGVGTARDFAFTNCTFAENEALGGVGGAIGIFAAVTVELENTILADGTVGTNCDGGAGVFVSNGNNIDSDSSCGLAGPNDQNGVDPMIGPLQDNGGFTRTHALLAGSPAIDKGSDVFCPGEDQRGIFRPFDGDGNGTATCDIGAFELNDCNGSGEDDAQDILNGTSTDCNANGIPDDCELDTDGDGVIDDCDNCPATANAGQEDADGNGVGDACEAGAGAAPPAPAGGCGTGLCATGAAPFMPLMLLGLRLSRRREPRRRR